MRHRSGGGKSFQILEAANLKEPRPAHERTSGVTSERAEARVTRDTTSRDHTSFSLRYEGVPVFSVPNTSDIRCNIVNISSIASMAPSLMPSMIAYSISKSGLDQFTKSAAKELAPNVRVNSINPGPVNTDFIENSGQKIDPAMGQKIMSMIPLERTSESEEIADLIAFVASDKAKGITGSIFVSDNGFLLKT